MWIDDFFKHNFFKVAFQLWNDSSTHLSSKVILTTRQPFVVQAQKSHQEKGPVA